MILCYNERQGGMSWIQYTSVHVEMLDVLLKTILCDYGGKVLTNRDLYEKLETKMAPIESGRYLYKSR